MTWRSIQPERAQYIESTSGRAWASIAWPPERHRVPHREQAHAASQRLQEVQITGGGRHG